MDRPEFVARNAKIARELKGLDSEKSREIVAKVAAYRNNEEVEIYRLWG
jgi:hypothetical protein